MFFSHPRTSRGEQDVWFRGGEGAPANDERMVERMRASRPRARPYGERTPGDFTENRTHRLHRNTKFAKIGVATSSTSCSRVTRRRARRVFPRWKKYPAMQTRGWWRPDGALASTTRSSSERTSRTEYFIQRKADSPEDVVERRARRSSSTRGKPSAGRDQRPAGSVHQWGAHKHSRR